MGRANASVGNDGQDGSVRAKSWSLHLILHGWRY